MRAQVRRRSTRILHRLAVNSLAPVLIAALVTGTPASAHAGGVVGAGTAASCTDAALNTALAGSGWVTFNCGENPVTIDISTGTGTKAIAADTIVYGGGGWSGPGITISGGNTVRVFSIGSGVKLTLMGLTIADGFGTDFGGGGGIYNGGGSLTVNYCTFAGNTGGPGAAIYNDGGPLNVISSTFDGNIADFRSGGAIGGAIYNGSGSIDIAGSTFTRNQALAPFDGGTAGAIYNGTGRLTVSGSAFIENVGGEGGAVYSSGMLAVTNSGFTDNAGAFGGGISSFGTLTVTNSTFSGNVAAGIFGVGTGGGLANYGDASLTDSTFTDNSAGSSGGGIGNVGTLSVANSTFVGNSALPNSIATSYGGGIENFGMLSVTNSTFTGNSAATGGGGIENGSGNASPDATTVLRNTIVADSPSGGNCSGPITDGGHNLDDGTSCGFSAANGSLNNTNPQLDPAGLQLTTAGRRQTVALCTAAGVPAGCAAASPAIDAGDQRRLCRRAGEQPRPAWSSFVPAPATRIARSVPTRPTPRKACTGDCDGNGRVAINQLILGVNIALGLQPVAACPAFANAQGMVDIAQLIQGVNNALNGCAG